MKIIYYNIVEINKVQTQILKPVYASEDEVKEQIRKLRKQYSGSKFTIIKTTKEEIKYDN